VGYRNDILQLAAQTAKAQRSTPASTIARSELHRELVPLAEAAAVAYHIISDNPRSLRNPRELCEVRCLVAIALSSAAPIVHGQDGAVRPMSAAEVEQHLFAPLSQRQPERSPPPDFAGLYIRRGDLVRAVEVLKRAHKSFGRADVLSALRTRQQ
jgi:hypothetical protein